MEENSKALKVVITQFIPKILFDTLSDYLEYLRSTDLFEPFWREQERYTSYDPLGRFTD